METNPCSNRLLWLFLILLLVWWIQALEKIGFVAHANQANAIENPLPAEQDQTAINNNHGMTIALQAATPNAGHKRPIP